MMMDDDSSKKLVSIQKSKINSQLPSQIWKIIEMLLKLSASQGFRETLWNFKLYKDLNVSLVRFIVKIPSLAHLFCTDASLSLE